jgi:hypothetical protein
VADLRHAACIAAETSSVPVDDRHIEQARAAHTVDAAFIDLESRGFTIDAAGIAADANALAITTRGLAFDEAGMDRETFLVPSMTVKSIDGAAASRNVHTN